MATITERDVRRCQGIARRALVANGWNLPTSADFDDLVQDLLEALWKCHLSYEDGKRASFRTYSYHRLQGAVVDHMRKRWGRRRRWRLGLEICEHDMPRFHSRQKESWNILLYGEREDKSPERPISVYVGHWSSEFGRAYEGCCSPLEAEQELSQLLSRVGASERDRDIFVLVKTGVCTLRDVAGRVGLSESRVCQIVKRIEAKLKRMVS